MRSFVAALVALVVTAGPVAADWVWTPDRGWYRPSKAVAPTAEALLQESAKAFAAERYDDAARGYRMLLELYPRAPEAGDAQRQLLESQFRAGEYETSLETIETILERRPDAETVQFVVEKKFQIGHAFLSGRKRSFWGLQVSAQGYGVEVLDSLVERFPYQSYSDDSLYHIASYFHREDRYEEAAIVYRRLIRDYPQSEWASLAEYQVGEAALDRLKGIDYDFTTVDEAERHFRRYLRLHPGGDRVQAARRRLAEIEGMRAEKLLRTARFYLRRERGRAARYYLQKVILDHPDSEASREAEDLLRGVNREPAR